MDYKYLNVNIILLRRLTVARATQNTSRDYTLCEIFPPGSWGCWNCYATP